MAAKARDTDYNGNRNRNRNRSAYQQNFHYRDRKNYYRNPDPISADTTEDTTLQEDAKSEKDGKTGLAGLAQISITRIGTKWLDS